MCTFVVKACSPQTVYLKALRYLILLLEQTFLRRRQGCGVIHPKSRTGVDILTAEQSDIIASRTRFFFLGNDCAVARVQAELQTREPVLHVSIVVVRKEQLAET